MPTKVLTAKSKSTRGFTMIELLVVLALLGAVSTIVVPQLWGQYTRFAQQQQVEKFWGKVRDRAVLLRKHGENFVFEQQNPKWQKLAAEYDLTLQKSDVIIVRADGFTAGGTINLQVESKEAYWKIEIATPDGTVNIARR